MYQFVARTDRKVGCLLHFHSERPRELIIPTQKVLANSWFLAWVQHVSEQPHFAALGSAIGVLQIVSLETGTLLRHYFIHGAGVKGLDWAGPHVVVCFVSEEAGSGMFRNIVYRVDLRSGRIQRARERTDDPSPVRALAC